MANRLCFMLASLLYLASTIPAVWALVPFPEPAPAAPPGICKSRVEIYGYECEEHLVTTKDGYILSLQRIPNGLTGAPKGKKKTPVLLQHGILMDGVSWLVNPPDESLGYILADSGYDVWIANSRGTVYSRGHTVFSADELGYWDWSWDELVAYDLPATFAYVYSHTRQKIHYVGHSMGTLMGLASFCQKKLLGMTRSAALISPIAYLDLVKSPIAFYGAEFFVAEAIYWLGIGEFSPMGESAHNLLKEICEQPGVNCFDLLTCYTGQNCCLDRSSVKVLLDHEPQPTSTKNMVHMAQMIRRGTITKFDYGYYNENMRHYGQGHPPAYNMSAIPTSLPLFLTYGGADGLSDVDDVKHLLKKLKSHKKHKLRVVYLPNYAHGDFILAVNAKQLVYDPLLAFFKLH